MAHLKILTGGQKGDRFDIDRDRVVIGRSSKNVVHIDDPSVSGEHCAVVREGRRFTLFDLNSTNGTRLNDVTVAEYELAPRDVIKVGAVEILFDGKDIDPRTEIAAPDPEATQVTVRMDTTDRHPIPTTPPTAFGEKKQKPWLWPTAIGLVGLIVTAALVWFFVKVLGR